MSDSAQLALLLGSTVLGFVILTLMFLGHRVYRIYATHSARFVTTSASTNLSKKIRNLVGPGVEILIPAGHGLYPLILSAWRCRKWEARIADWIKQGAHVSIVISSASDRAIEYWQRLVDRIGPGLTVSVLDRSKATKEDAAEISRLDTFHPILVTRHRSEPLAMWVEGYHPPLSRVAYNVEYVAQKDIVAAQRDRFELFLKILRRLTDPDLGQPHLRQLSPHAMISASTPTTPVERAA